ncbi:heme-degrading domain-containing protein [uncultured Cohaesibacter sp.]|uniref:heme-degrading domain-containing protein n=1 Tax=uncultured Cohaesibacter sp. TaxID=1002546 RepID=UPI0029C64E4C|nr:heme-degrading domain-containing protein [uncultured Cohaesibacter sp.]
MTKLTELNDTDLLAAITTQEDELRFEDFSVATAHTLGNRFVALAKERSLPIAIDITCAGHCLFHMAMEGATPDNAEWIERKKRVVGRFHHSSLYMGLLCKLSDTVLETRFHLPPNQFAPHGGCFPIRLKGGAVIGTITVSGLPQVEDHALVTEVIAEYLGAA